MRKIGVLLSGGVNAGSNHSRYLNDLREMYRGLLESKYTKGDIFVLYADGSAHDLDGDGKNDIHGACTNAALNTLFQTTLPGRLTDQDLLFIFCTNHGGPIDVATRRSKLWLWGDDSIEDSVFAALVNNLQFHYLIVCMGQCNSGGFIDDLSGNNRVIATACRHDEPSWPCDSEGDYDEFCYYWTTAVRGKRPGGEPISADMDGDGIVSLRDAFVFAQANDSRSEQPQYAESPSGLGILLTLVGPVSKWHFDKQVLRVGAKIDSQAVWAIVAGVGIEGWIRIRPASPDGVTNNAMILAEALAKGYKVDVLIDNGEITQAVLR